MLLIVIKYLFKVSSLRTKKRQTKGKKIVNKKKEIILRGKECNSRNLLKWQRCLSGYDPDVTKIR